MDTEHKKTTATKKWLMIILGIWAVVAIGAIVLVYLYSQGLLTFAPSEPIMEVEPDVAEATAPAEEFELQNLAGETVSLSSFQGQVVMLNFWATWCIPCVREMPMFEEIYQKYAPKLVVLGVDVGEPPEKVKLFLTKMNLNYPILLDTRSEVAKLYTVVMLPTTIFIDEAGIVRFKQFGQMTERQLEDYLLKMGVAP